MTQYIINIGAYPDDGQGSPLRTAFDYTNENFNQIFAAGPVLSNIQIGNNTITTTVLNSNLILSPSGIGRIQLNNTLFPRSDNVYDIGTPTLRFNSIYLGTGGINTTGGITTTGNITAGYFIGNGSQLTGIVATTGSQVVNGTSNLDIPSAGSNIFVTVNGTSNVVAFANTGVYVAGQVSATGNIAGNYILGNGALLTGINIGYGNSNVANFLPTYTGNLVSLTGPVTTTANITGGNLRTGGQISATGNITGGNVNTGRLNAGYITVGTTISAVGNIATSSYFIGDGSQLTNLPAGNYSNANVAAFLPIYTGNLVSLTGPVTTTANVTGGNLITSGRISATGNLVAGNVDTTRLDADYVTVAGYVSAIGNVYGNNLVGNRLVVSGNISGTNISASGNVVGGNVLSVGIVSTSGNVAGHYFIGNGALLTGITVSGGTSINNGTSNVVVSPNGNIDIGVAGVGNVATFANTGAYISGNVTTGGILTDNYYYANGTPIPFGIVYTAATAPPPDPNVGDQWWDTTNSVLYEYLNDGTSNYWVDTTSPAFAGGVVANVAISGTLVPVANVTFDIGTSNVYFRNTYTQNLYTNNRLPAYNMPLGAVVKTVMSSSLGGSITNSTSYADITYANVTITTSSAASKVLIIVTGTSSFSALAGANVIADTQLVRSPSTSLQIQTCGASVASGGVGTTGAISYSYLDSPATNGSITYKLQQRVSNASSTLTSTNIWLIAMEIAA